MDLHVVAIPLIIALSEFTSITMQWFSKRKIESIFYNRKLPGPYIHAMAVVLDVRYTYRGKQEPRVLLQVQVMPEKGRTS